MSFPDGHRSLSVERRASSGVRTPATCRRRNPGVFVRHALVGTVAAALAAEPAGAQWPSYSLASSKGPFVGVQGDVVALGARERLGETDFGGGARLHAGYGIRPQFAIVIDAGRATIYGDEGRSSLVHVDFVARYALAGFFRHAMPYVEGGFSHRRLALDADVPGSTPEKLGFSGPGIAIGGGLQLFLSPRVAVGGALRWATGPLNATEDHRQLGASFGLDARSTRISAGLTWYLRPPR